MCRITAYPKDGVRISRRAIYNFAKDKAILVCPFSFGGPITFIQAPCSPDDMKGIGKYINNYKVNSVDNNKSYDAMSECTPLMGIKDRKYNYQHPVKSYLLVNKLEKFSPGVVRNSDDLFDHELRQFLNNVGAPLVYYNGISNVICMSIRSGESFSLEDTIKEFGFKAPAGISIETSNSNCPSWVKERFHISLSEPAAYP